MRPAPRNATRGFVVPRARRAGEPPALICVAAPIASDSIMRGIMRTSYLLAIALLALGGHAALADVNQVDRDFATMAFRANKTEIEDAQWAAKTDEGKPLWRLAEEMIRNHTSANDMLAREAHDQHMTLPSLPTVDQQGFNRKLQDLHGDALREAYVRHEIEQHQHQIAAYQKELSEGQSLWLKHYAKRYLPVFQAELKSAKAVRGQETG
jgi:putative membrane protein